MTELQPHQRRIAGTAETGPMILSMWWPDREHGDRWYHGAPKVSRYTARVVLDPTDGTVIINGKTYHDLHAEIDSYRFSDDTFSDWRVMLATGFQESALTDAARDRLKPLRNEIECVMVQEGDRLRRAAEAMELRDKIGNAERDRAELADKVERMRTRCLNVEAELAHLDELARLQEQRHA